jgi:hypothetical protein
MKRKTQINTDTAMIKVLVSFWTTGLDRKHCLTKGKIKLIPNERHKLQRLELHFQSLPDLLAKFEKVFAEGQITVHPSQRERRYRAH